MMDWIRAHPAILGWSFGLSILLFVGSLVVMPILIARMSSTYFVSRELPEESWRRRHSIIRFTVLILKNVVGAILLLAGLVMLILPGQGVITILVGTSLLNFPGKRRLELLIVRQPTVLRAIQWIRAKAGRPPLILPEPEPD